MKWLMISVLLLLVGGSWAVFSMKGSEIGQLRDEITKAEDIGDPQGIVPELKNKADGLEGEKTFVGILLTFLSAGVAGGRHVKPCELHESPSARPRGPRSCT